MSDFGFFLGSIGICFLFCSLILIILSEIGDKYLKKTA